MTLMSRLGSYEEEEPAKNNKKCVFYFLKYRKYELVYLGIVVISVAINSVFGIMLRFRILILLSVSGGPPARGPGRIFDFLHS